jgi:peptide/nickel transport system permease protein
LVAAILAATVLGRAATPYDPYQTQLTPAAAPPGEYVFGTDTLGRDVLSRVLDGGAHTLVVGAVAAVIALATGGLLGVVGATIGGITAAGATLLSNAMLAIPAFLIALVVVTSLGTTSWSTATAAGLAQAGISSQVWRGIVSQLLHEPYVEGALAVGATRNQIARRHLLPNAIPVIAAYGCALFASSVLLTSGLSFLGLTGEPASTDWGNLIAEGRRAFRTAPWIMVAPSAALIAVTAALDGAARLIRRRG